MRADEVQVFIVDVDLSGRDLEFQGAICVFTGHGVSAGLIQHIRHASQFKRRKAIR